MENNKRSYLVENTVTMWLDDYLALRSCLEKLNRIREFCEESVNYSGEHRDDYAITQYVLKVFGINYEVEGNING